MNSLTNGERRAIADFLSYLYPDTLTIMADTLQNLTSQYSDAAANGCVDEAKKIDTYRKLVNAEIEKSL